jgi:hypothetical protein
MSNNPCDNIEEKAEEFAKTAEKSESKITEILKKIVLEINDTKEEREKLLDVRVKSRVAVIEGTPDIKYDEELNLLRNKPLVKMVGLKFRKKEGDSIIRKMTKICSDNANNKDNANDKDPIIRDAVRYTFILPQLLFDAVLVKIDEKLKGKGITLHPNPKYSKNTFCDGNMYKGLNRTYTYTYTDDKDKVKLLDFEIQYHTALSWNTKPKLHEMYEYMRKAGTENPEKYCKLYNESIELTNSIEDPIIKADSCKANIGADNKLCNSKTYEDMKYNGTDYFEDKESESIIEGGRLRRKLRSKKTKRTKRTKKNKRTRKGRKSIRKGRKNSRRK